MELISNSGDISMPAPVNELNGATLDIALDTPLDMSGFFSGGASGTWEFSYACKFMLVKFIIVMLGCFHGVLDVY